MMKNEDKNNKLIIPKLDLLNKNDEFNIKNKNKSNSSINSITHNNNNSHILINCNNTINIFISNDNLPKIRKYFDKNVSSSSKTKDSYSKDITNIFLKSNGKSLNPVKNKKIVSTSLNFTDKKKYLLSNKKKLIINQKKI